MVKIGNQVEQFLTVWNGWLNVNTCISRAYFKSSGHFATLGGRVTQPFAKTCPFFHEMVRGNVCEINPSRLQMV